MNTDTADKQFAIFIKNRDNWTCQKCMCAKERSRMDCAHYYGRGISATRFWIDNCVTLCRECHGYFHAHPHEHRNFMKKRLGGARWDLLQKLGNRVIMKKSEAIEEFCRWHKEV